MREVVGYTTGVYDMFHIGHLNVIERAAASCDRLIVGVTTDELCLERKHKTPVIPFAERSRIVGALGVVHSVVPQADMDKWAAWERYGFDVMFVGDDWKGTPQWLELEERFSDVGVRIEYFPYTQHTSSTLLRKALNIPE